MINEMLCANILDVLHYRKSAGKIVTHARSFHALSFRLESEGYFSTDGRKIKTRTGDIAYVPAGASYSVLGGNEQIIVIHFYAINDLNGDIRVFHPQKPQKYQELFKQALACWEKKEPGYRLRTAALFYTILSDIAKEQARTEDRDCDPIHTAARRIERELADPQLSIHAIASELYMSDALFRRRFKAVFGVSPKYYLDSLRFRHAVALLETGYFTQTQIASRCGFSDVKYFRQAFKKYFGQSISHYQYHFEEQQ